MPKDIMQQAISNLQAEKKTVSPVKKDYMQQAAAELQAEQGKQSSDENIWEAPEFVRKIAPLKAAVGTGQELAEFLGNIPRLFGMDYEVPKAVDTGIGEKAAAGIMEYLLGGGAARAIPAIGKGFQALGQIPKVGRALGSPMAQRALGGAAMGVLGEPETPARGALTGAGLSAGIETGFKIAPKTLGFLAKGKWSPFHSAMMPHIRNEFNEFIDSTGRKLGLTIEHDADKALFDNLSEEYGVVTKEANNLYNEASDAFKEVKYPVYWKEGLRGRTLPLIKDIRNTYKKATDSFGIKINKSMQNLEEKIDDPVSFRRKLHALKRDALKTGNHDLHESLDKIEGNFDKNLNNLANKTKDENLSNALKSLKDADTYFRENVVPFRNRGSVKLAEGKRKMIPTKFFEAHTKDTSKDLSKKINYNIKDLEHTSKISPRSKEYLTFSHLKEGFNKPEQFIKQYSKLSKEQKDSLFSKDQISRFNKFIKIYEKNPSAFKEASVSSIMGAIKELGGATIGKAMASIPGAKESYISQTPLSTDRLRNMVMGALLGQTKD